MSLVIYRDLSVAHWHRRNVIERLHLFPDDNIPPALLQNVSSQLPQVMPKARRIDEYSKEEIDSFPALFDFPDDYTQEYDGSFGK